MTRRKTKTFRQFYKEDAPVNVVANVAGLSTEPVLKAPIKSNIKRRKKPVV
jgi:hypothetical protein